MSTASRVNFYPDNGIFPLRNHVLLHGPRSAMVEAVCCCLAASADRRTAQPQNFAISLARLVYWHSSKPTLTALRVCFHFGTSGRKHRKGELCGRFWLCKVQAWRWTCYGCTSRLFLLVTSHQPWITDGGAEERESVWLVSQVRDFVMADGGLGGC